MEIPFRGSGTIVYSGKNYKCSLYYSENGGVIVIEIKHYPENGIGDFLELPLEIDKLGGKLDSGYEFTLLELKREGTNDNISSGTTVYTYYAEYMLSGIRNVSSESQTFSRAEFVIANIVEWGGESIYYIGEDHELKKKQELEIVIYAGKEYSIYYRVSGSFLPCVKYELLKEDIVLKQHGCIEIKYSEERDFADFIAVFNKLKSLFEIALLEPVRIERIYAFSSKIRNDYGDLSFERRIDIYGTSIKAEDESENNGRLKRHNWITLSDLIDNNSVIVYMDKHYKLEPIIDLFKELFYLKGNTVTREFLNVVQALETYHSRFVTNDMKVFKQRIDRITQGFTPAHGDRVRNVLLANSNKFITLESRLADLLFAEGDMQFDIGDIEYADFPSIIAHTRNYYIHYDESIKSQNQVFTIDELIIYKKVLFQILEYYILYELGFSIEDRRKKISDRWGSVSMDLQILKASRSKKY